MRVFLSTTLIFVGMLMGLDTMAADSPAAPDLKFKLHRVGTYRGEACCVGDFNKDGKLDIVALPYLYLAPEFKPQRICEVQGEVDENGKGYHDDFMNAALDVDDDGWLDVITCTWFAKKSEWLKNPGAAGGMWIRNLIDELGNHEAGEMVDIDGDGKALEFLPTVAVTVWYEKGKLPDGKPGMIKHVISEKQGTWGTGCGDVNGDGRPDILRPDFWFEGPADPRAGEWKEHPLGFSKHPDGIKADTAHILVHDVNGDKLPDLIASAAHDYGLFWFEQGRDGENITWTQHLIDKSWSQVHSLRLADLDNDGDMEIIAGKRFMAHNGSDPGEMEPLGVYWYDLSRKPTPTWTKHIISYDEGIGSGMNIEAEDLDADGDIDIIVTGKWGGPAWFENTLK